MNETVEPDTRMSAVPALSGHVELVTWLSGVPVLSGQVVMEPG